MKELSEKQYTVPVIQGIMLLYKTNYLENYYQKQQKLNSYKQNSKKDLKLNTEIHLTLS